MLDVEGIKIWFQTKITKGFCNIIQRIPEEIYPKALNVLF
jgi:hypothetical protein